MPSIFPWRETGVALKIFHQSIDWWIWSGKNYGKNWGWTVNRVFDHEFLCQINGQREMCDWRCASIFRGAWLWAEMKCWGLASQWEKKTPTLHQARYIKGAIVFIVSWFVSPLQPFFKSSKRAQQTSWECPTCSRTSLGQIFGSGPHGPWTSVSHKECSPDSFLIVS